MQRASPVQMSHKRAVTYVNISEPCILRQLIRRVCRACSMNSWRFPFSSRTGMEQLPSPIKDVSSLYPHPHILFHTTFVNISFPCSFHSSILLLTSFSPPPLLTSFLFLSLTSLSYCFVIAVKLFRTLHHQSLLYLEFSK